MFGDLFYVEKFEYFMPNMRVIVDAVKGGLFNSHPPQTLSLITACDSYTLSYAGSYRIVGDIVYTDVKVSNRDSFKDATIYRQIMNFDEDRLVLNKDYPERTVSLTWRKLHESLVPTDSQPWVVTFKQVVSRITHQNGVQFNEIVVKTVLTMT